ncbi:type II secretion system minor pseudopilin GspJ, partial [Escherichia coli]|uniref:type II secretion system minor pseudopilin GspJ n=1 Tax=Escherichia coli TaxID=562 RepID=UPI00108163E4
KLNLMQQTMSFLTHDLTQMMPRPVRGEQGQREPALLAGAGVLASESEGMRFVRGGVVNPLMRLPRSNLLTVGYRIHDGYLERLSWPLTDAAGSVKPTTQKLIPADSLRLQFYDGTRWQESWSSVQAIPVAVRMTLHSPQWGEIERIWLLRGPQLSCSPHHQNAEWHWSWC